MEKPWDVLKTVVYVVVPVILGLGCVNASLTGEAIVLSSSDWTIEGFFFYTLLIQGQSTDLYRHTVHLSRSTVPAAW